MQPELTRHLAFGDLAATWKVLERLKVAPSSTMWSAPADATPPPRSEHMWRWPC